MWSELPVWGNLSRGSRGRGLSLLLTSTAPSSDGEWREGGGKVKPDSGAGRPAPPPPPVRRGTLHILLWKQKQLWEAPPPPKVRAALWGPSPAHPTLNWLGLGRHLPSLQREAEGMGMGQLCPASLLLILSLSLPQSPPFLPLCLLPPIGTPPPPPPPTISKQSSVPASGRRRWQATGGRQRH